MIRIPRAALAIVAAAVPLHLVLALGTDLSPDEAYYLCAARRGHALVDHPPLLPWLLRLGDHLGGPVELRVRLWAILLSAATGLACVELARRRGAGGPGMILAAWIGSWALLPTAGGFVTTPDGPALLAITVALAAAGDPLTPRRSAVASIALLLGVLAKVVVLPVAALLAVTSVVTAPRSLRRRAALLAAPLMAVPALALPLLAPSLRFQLHHAFTQTAAAGWSLAGAAGAVLGALGAQALLWSPAVVWRGARALPGAPPADRAVAYALAGLLCVSALLRAVPPEPNWWAPAALLGVVAFARSAADLGSRARRAILLSVLAPTAVAAGHTLVPFLPLPERADPTARLHGWSRGRGPSEAAGVGRYGPAAERCVYQQSCSEIDSYFNEMKPHEGSRFELFDAARSAAERGGSGRPLAFH